MKNMTKKITLTFISFFSIILLFGFLFPLQVVASSEEMLAEMETRKELPVQSNEFMNWPIGPQIGAQGAILFEANSNTILYSKNCNERLYPASTTKILTSILIMENCNLDEVITFSKEAIDSISWDDSNMGASIGDQITVEQALYAILVGSANEAAYAMAEYISGDIDSFAILMNEKAKELGCLNSHFSNPSGLHNDSHYTTAYDLSLIAKEFFKYDFLCKLSSTYSYEIFSSTAENDSSFLYTKNKLLSNREYAYPDLVGSKTGYTSLARQTLVSCAQKNGMSLICVVLRDEAPYQFEDTISLFDYGFSNFTNISIAENETNYQFSFSEPFQCDYSVFGDTTPLVTYDSQYNVTLPISANFSNLNSEIDLNLDSGNYYNRSFSNTLAHITYYYYGTYVGYLPINFEKVVSNKTALSNLNTTEDVTFFSDNSNVCYIQLKKIFFIILLIFIPLLFLSYLKTLFFNTYISKKRTHYKHKRKSSSPYKSIKF